MPKIPARQDALRELRALVATYLEGSDDAPRAAELLEAIGAPPSETARARNKREERERRMFGCTAASIDEALAGKTSRDIAIYAIGTLSNAQDLFQPLTFDRDVEWTVPSRHVDTIRQFINVAKYAIDKAIPR